MKTIYENTVVSLGALVDSFQDEGMFITFGDQAPDTLKDFCYGVDVKPVDGDIKAGQTLIIDGAEYKITAVGDIAKRNLESLGHVTVVFSGAAEADLTGSICVEEKAMPKLKVGSSIKIIE